MSQSLFFITSSHLFPIDSFPDLDHSNILMIEDFGFFTRFKYHKKKLVFNLEAMRNYADLLRDHGFNVTYIQLSEEMCDRNLEFYLEKELKRVGCSRLESYEIEERFLRKRLLHVVKKHQLRWITHKNPMFLHSIENFEDLLGSMKQPRMRFFYEQERRERNILMENGRPLGGQFSFDQENRKRLPQSISIPDLPLPTSSEHHRSVCQIVDELFAEHPGDTSGCWLPASRAGAQEWLDVFLEERLPQFGDYEDAISQKELFLFHSTLTPFLNIGLLTPQEVIDKALQQSGIPLNSMEGFVRQIIGWREFIRGIDECFGAQQEQSNFFRHERLLTPEWWRGETGLLPVDHTIQRVIRYGYCHHIERLMILSNVMLLLEVNPQEVYRWFMEMFIDSADWVMGPNVYGMGQFSDGGLFATKPYICGSNYIRKMSDFPKGEWCDLLDGLYWKFIDKRRPFFKSQPRLNMMVATLDRMAEKKRHHLFALATEFQEKVTIQSTDCRD